MIKPSHLISVPAVWLGLLMTCAAPGAGATAITYTLDQTEPGTHLTGSPWGTITVTQDAANARAIDIALNLASGYVIHKTQGQTHPALAFSLLNNPSVVVDFLGDNAGLFSAHGNVVNGDPKDNDPVKAAGWGNFPYYIDCDGCQPGYAANGPRTLLFSVTPTVGSLAPASIVSNGGAYFSVDIQNAGGITGNVVSTAAVPLADMVTSQVTPVPEPGSVLLLGVGLMGMGWAGYRKARLA